jgi:hypothetical protein
MHRRRAVEEFDRCSVADVHFVVELAGIGVLAGHLLIHPYRIIVTTFYHRRPRSHQFGRVIIVHDVREIEFGACPAPAFSWQRDMLPNNNFRP